MQRTSTCRRGSPIAHSTLWCKSEDYGSAFAWRGKIDACTEIREAGLEAVTSLRRWSTSRSRTNAGRQSMRICFSLTRLLQITGVDALTQNINYRSRSCRLRARAKSKESDWGPYELVAIYPRAAFTSIINCCR